LLPRIQNSILTYQAWPGPVQPAGSPPDWSVRLAPTWGQHYTRESPAVTIHGWFQVLFNGPSTCFHGKFFRVSTYV